MVWGRVAPVRTLNDHLMSALLLNQREKYHMGPWICKKSCTLCPLYRPEQGNIVGRNYIKVCKFLQIHGPIWYFSRWFNNRLPIGYNDQCATLPSSNQHEVHLTNIGAQLYGLWVRAWSVPQKCCSGKYLCLAWWSFPDTYAWLRRYKKCW
jgi:hypothetical protein